MSSNESQATEALATDVQFFLRAGLAPDRVAPALRDFSGYEVTEITDQDGTLILGVTEPETGVEMTVTIAISE